METRPKDLDPWEPVDASRRRVVKLALTASAASIPVVSSVVLGGASAAFAETPNISGQTTTANPSAPDESISDSQSERDGDTTDRPGSTTTEPTTTAGTPTTTAVTTTATPTTTTEEPTTTIGPTQTTVAV